MRKKIRKILVKFNRSNYARPLTLFSLLFIAAGLVTFWIERDINTGQFGSFVDGLWWSIITFSTTGYGDIVPKSIPGRLIAIFTIILGVAAMSFVSGMLASIFVDRNTKARRGLVDFPKKRDHFIICGWKDHMKDILLDILQFSNTLDSEDIIIISNIDSERIEELKEIPELQGINFVRGDYFSETVLKRANVIHAKKVLILADTFESSATSEIDSKTVMAVLTIKGMAKDVYTCAEILDTKYESYLRQAMCDEVLFSRDFTRRMLASTSATSGLSHIMYELLSYGSSQSRLVTLEIPVKYVGRQYSDYRSSLKTRGSALLLGLLENTGTPNKMKMEALRLAQQTSDVSRLVSNLQQVKELEVNTPVFLPGDEYVIQKHSKAILLERMQES